MPQSLSYVVVHLVFSTKDRQPLLNADLLGRMHAYLAGTVRELGCNCYKVGGVSDHVHLAVGLSRTLSLAKLTESTKALSSKWAKTYVDDFSWQRGYGAFGASIESVPNLIAYIENQQMRHQNQSFQEEYRQLLIEHGIAFDERYVWD